MKSLKLITIDLENDLLYSSSHLSLLWSISSTSLYIRNYELSNNNSCEDKVKIIYKNKRETKLKNKGV